MEVPIILQHLKDYHQNTIERDEITHIREDIINFIHDFSKKTGLRGSNFGNKLCPDSSQNCYISKLNNLLPKSEFSPRLNLFSLLAKFSNKVNINASVPTTLIKLEETSCIIRTKKDGKIHSKPCTSEDFFNLTQEKKDSDCPLFCFKSPGQDTVAVFTIDSALKIWNPSETNAFMQQFIQGRSSTISFTRVLWRQGLKNKYFNIVNKAKKEKKLKKISPKQQKLVHKRSISSTNLSEFKYRDMMLPSSQSVNNPYKVAKTPIKNKNLKNASFSELPKQDLGINRAASPGIFSRETKQCSLTEELSKIIGEGTYKEFIVTTKDSESCYAIESLVKIPEIENMVNQIVQFLNNEIFQNSLKAIVLDFLQNRNNNWFLLDCKEYLADEIEKKKIIMPRINKPRRSRSLICHKKVSNFEDEEIKSEEPPKDIIKRQKTVSVKLKPSNTIKERPRITDEKELLQRCAEVNQKVDQIISSKKLLRASSTNFIQTESPHNYLSSSSYTQLNDMTPLPNTPVGKKRLQISESLWDDKCHHMTQKHFSGIIENFDEMTLNAHVAKLKRQNLVEKYGGDQFWNNFILSLYNKVLGSEQLYSYFKNCNLDNFEMIVTGMFKIFNGNVSLEFRRKVRGSHLNRGINENEFNAYSDLFEKTLVEFQVEEEDKHAIMMQIKSMKCLICR
ncbi:unnamed protein product [Blepharisma stoltei]|uniref:Uncharacterized protein n=1 Tax=Blepharisma stoltei TaxID=1481888 RepID=A0AAU9K981_9CILI|nr:unnamed protein product [Blepharisma stoltei]